MLSRRNYKQNHLLKILNIMQYRRKRTIAQTPKFLEFSPFDLFCDEHRYISNKHKQLKLVSDWRVDWLVVYVDSMVIYANIDVLNLSKLYSSLSVMEMFHEYLIDNCIWFKRNPLTPSLTSKRFLKTDYIWEENLRDVVINLCKNGFQGNSVWGTSQVYDTYWYLSEVANTKQLNVWSNYQHHAMHNRQQLACLIFKRYWHN